ncbi:MAG: DUF2442 domain-containing protein [bacterium]|nr:DUF2442 domain-containing protein [bacterium]
MAERVDKQFGVKRYKVQYPISAYTFPQEARIHQVRFDNECMHVKLIDGRVLSIPLRWVPTLYHAVPEEREKYEINQNRTIIVWDPDKCAINDEVCITNYLSPCREET